MPRILVAGIGNLLMGDDGAGVHAVRELLRGRRLRSVEIAEVGVAVIRSLPLFERADKVLAIDALEGGGKPGDLYLLRLADACDPAVKPSLHDVGLRSAMELLAERRPEVLVLGVEPGRIDYGMELSPPVLAALPRLVAAARDIVREWRA